MRPVCTPDGHMAVADICLPDNRDEAQLFDRMERLNDPSLVHALTEGEWFALFERAGLPRPTVLRYIAELPLVRMLQAASRSPEEIAAAEAEVRRALAGDRLRGLAAIDGETTVFCCPIAVFAAPRSAA